MSSFAISQHPAPLSKKEVESISAANVHQVLERTMLVDGFDIVYDMGKSHDCLLHDAKSNKEFMDFFSMFASWPISHNHPRLQCEQFQKQMGKIATHNPANSDIYTIEMAQFVATFERVCKPKEFTHLFFVAGGTLAVENALKASFDWKVRKNLAKGKGEKGKQIIHFKEAFHGRSGYSLALTNTQDPNKYKYFPLFNWPRVEFPKVVDNISETIEAEKRSAKQLIEILEKDGDDIAAIIVEPVQGEGGDNHMRPEFFQLLRKLADKYEVMLIADEVQCGMGISGKMWTYQHLGAVPDIVCFGKKAQVCGIMATSRIDDVKDNVFVVSSRINSTWGGSLTDMARARKIMEVIEEENLVGNAQKVGAYLLEQLKALSAKFPGVMTNIRGKGLHVAFDVPSSEYCSKLKSLAYERGVLIISSGVKTIRFRPLLDIAPKNIDVLIDTLSKCFSILASQQPKSKL